MRKVTVASLRSRKAPHSGGKHTRLLPAVHLLVASFVICVSSSLWLAASAKAAPSASATPTVWLCRPGLAKNPCTAPLTTTVVRPNGSRSIQTARPARNPPIDCFYVYPTVSQQKAVNANLHIDPQEQAVAHAQASRFSQVCRVYAPMYPQLTLSAISKGPTAIPAQGAVTAYLGVLSAWKDYLAHYNHGRGVVLIGHSQGASLLVPLMQREIDPECRTASTSRLRSPHGRQRDRARRFGRGWRLPTHSGVSLEWRNWVRGGLLEFR